MNSFFIFPFKSFVRALEFIQHPALRIGGRNVEGAFLTRQVKVPQGRQGHACGLKRGDHLQDVLPGRFRASASAGNGEAGRSSINVRNLTFQPATTPSWWISTT